MRPIHEIHRINAFKDEVSSEERTSLHIVPSFINHSCVDNVYRAHYGDVMMVYAIRDIQKGEGLVWTYVSWKYPYEHREAYLWSEHRIRCDCLLCELDRSDKRRKRRDKLVQKAEMLVLLAANKRELVAKLEPIVQEIRETYSSRQQFRLRLLVPLTILYDAYSELENLDRCVHISAEMLDCLEESYILGEGPDICRKAFALLHKFSERYADSEHVREHYAVAQDKYATLLRECVKMRSGLDIDFLASIVDGRLTGFP
ncbi:TPR domain-containing protein [Aphelenchoides avenae]|nr:TPR domain-containing protein [Aphelenchus avenae]